MNQREEEFNFYDLFIPLTTKKVTVFIVIISFIVFLTSFSNPFVLDDITQVVTNPMISHLSSIPTLFLDSVAYPGTNSIGILQSQYRPLLFFIFTVVFTIFGNTSWPFHILQFGIHTVNAILLFFLFKRFFKKSIAFFLSLIFLVHPLNSEAVIYIANLQDPLFLLFGLLSLQLIMKQSRFTPKYLFLIFLLLLLSLLAKETGILFVFIILLYGWIFARVTFKQTSMISAITIATYILIRFMVSFHSYGVLTLSQIQRTSLFERMITIPKILFYYLSHFFLPVHLAVGQEWLVTQIDSSNFFLPLFFDILFFACLVIGGIFIYKKEKTLFQFYLFFAGWFCVGIGMHMQFIPLDATVADRYFYFPIIGLLGLAGIFLSVLMKHKGYSHYVATLYCAVIVVLSIMTIIRISQWHTKFQLYSHDIHYMGENPVIYSSYGAQLMSRAQFAQAKPYLETSVHLNPYLGHNIDNLALWYEHNKDFPKAKALYWKNIHLNNSLPKPMYVSFAYTGLARISLAHDNNPQEAMKLSQLGLQKYPLNTSAMMFLGVSEYRLGEKNKALTTIQKLYNLDPRPEVQQAYNLIETNKPINLDPIYGALAIE